MILDPLALTNPTTTTTTTITDPTATPARDPDPLAPFAPWLDGLAHPATRRSYARALGAFLAYAKSAYLAATPDELTDGTLSGWADHLSQVGTLAPATIRRMRGAVRGALAWWRREHAAARLAEVEREQRACIALMQAQLVAYHSVVAGLHAAIQASRPGAVVCGCSFVEECHRADCPLQQAAQLLAQAA